MNYQFQFLSNGSFNSGQMRSEVAQILSMNPTEYAERLKAWGYGEQAIEQELKMLEDYRARITPPKVEVPEAEAVELDNMNPWVAAAKRRRAERKEMLLHRDAMLEGDEDGFST